jgi:hypothetical protein
VPFTASVTVWDGFVVVAGGVEVLEPLLPLLEPEEPDEPVAVESEEPLLPEFEEPPELELGEELEPGEECEPELPPEDESLPPVEEELSVGVTTVGASAIAPDSVAPPLCAADLRVAPPLPGPVAVALPAFGRAADAARPPVPPAVPSDTGSALAGATAFWPLVPNSAIGQSWNTWAETSTAKTTIAAPIKVTPERAPTR